MTFYNQHSTALVGAAGQPEGYTIERSLRFRSFASAYLNRTFTSAGNRKTFTWSSWVKRAKLGSFQTIFGAVQASLSGYSDGFVFDSSDRIYLSLTTSGLNAEAASIVTTQVFRDPSAWYHIVLVVDTTQATASNRIKFYVNNSQITAFTTANYPSQNFDCIYFNNSNLHQIGRAGSTWYPDHYLTEVNFIDGQALDPSYFGETDTDTGAWIPIEYSGSYGTNGFYLDFSNNSSTTTLGYDQSSNSNNWTCNNISLTAGSTYDSMQDVPTLTDADTANFCTLNPLDNNSGVVSEGNLKYADNGSDGWNNSRGTIGVSSGKWYWELSPVANMDVMCASVASNLFPLGSLPGQTNNYGVTYYNNGLLYKETDGAGTSYGASYTTNDIIGVALDMDAGSVTFYKNNVSQGVASTNLKSYGDTWFPITGVYRSTTTVVYNFGQRPFTYTPPTGYKALNTYNLPTPTIKDGSGYFGVLTWTGTGGNRTIADGESGVTGTVNFTPDFVWTKSRSSASSHMLYDTLRGYGDSSELSSNQTIAEGGDSGNLYGYVSGNATGGFTTVAGSTNADYTNTSSRTYVAWNWKANGSGVSNTDGSITSTVSANTSSGFSIVTYTGTGTAGTIGHGLGTAPSMIILKNRSSAYDWAGYHVAGGPTINYPINVNNTGYTNTAYWNDTSPTSSVFSVGSSSANTNDSGSSFVAYCFAPVEGFSAFGKYTGNGSTDGPFVYTGFRPAWVLVKSSSLTYGWVIVDTARNTYNIINSNLFPHASAAEDSSTGYFNIDAVSNGFKLKTTNGVSNQSSATYIYAAFAENPFKYSLAR